MYTHVFPHTIIIVSIGKGYLYGGKYVREKFPYTIITESEGKRYMYGGKHAGEKFPHIIFAELVEKEIINEEKCTGIYKKRGGL